MSTPRKIRCTVDSIIDHGGRVYTVDLQPDTAVPVFRPGQFLHLTVDDYDPSGFWPESRVFSIASSPNERQCLRICYSVKGRYTAKMEQLLAPGRGVWVKLPYGDFLIDDSADAVLIAGGTGISAFTAFIQALKPSHSRRVMLAYGTRKPSLFLFQAMLSEQAERVPHFRLIYFTEEPGEAPRQGLYHGGRISLDLIFGSLTSDLGAQSSPVFYLSGPPGMLTALGAELRSRGVVPGNIRTDAWE